MDGFWFFRLKHSPRSLSSPLCPIQIIFTTLRKKIWLPYQPWIKYISCSIKEISPMNWREGSTIRRRKSNCVDYIPSLILLLSCTRRVLTIKNKPQNMNSSQNNAINIKSTFTHFKDAKRWVSSILLGWFYLRFTSIKILYSYLNRTI